MIALERQAVIIGLIYMLNLGRYFTYSFIDVFRADIEDHLQINTLDIRHLFEWTKWPNMILCVIIGYALDFVFNLKHALMVLSTMGLMGQMMQAGSMHNRSTWLLSVAQIIRGVSYESIYIIQMTLIGRIFPRNLVYAPVAMLIALCHAMLVLGNFVMPTIGGSLAMKGIICTIPHIFSFICAILLFCGTDVNKQIHEEEFKTAPNPILKFSLILLIVVLYLYPSVEFWIGFSHSLKLKYDINVGEKNFSLVFYLTNCVVLIISGFVFNRRESGLQCKCIILIVSIAVMLMVHLILTFTFIGPWLMVAMVGAANAMTELILRTSLFFMVPKTEYNTAMGFIQGMENLSLAMSADLNPTIIVFGGLIILGSVNILCNILALFLSMILWYLH